VQEASLVRNSILRRLAKIQETSTARLQGAVDISVMNVHIEDMRMSSAPRTLTISGVRVAKSSIARPINDRHGWAHFRNPHLPQAALENELVLSEQLIARAYRRDRRSQHSGSDDRLPEEHTKTRNHKNPKDKATRVVIEGFVVVGGQPVGIAHAKLLGRPPARQPHQTLIKIC
jgi:hypothetical protein